MPLPTHHTINYIEFPATDIAHAKSFYASVFGWTIQEWGPDYASFSAGTAGIDGGFRKCEVPAAASPDGPLVVLYSRDLNATEQAILAAGGAIVVPTFAFPGGRRFHFTDGAGNLLAVWSE